MAERFNAAVLKTVDGETHPGVRIPLPPPSHLIDTKLPVCISAVQTPKGLQLKLISAVLPNFTQSCWARVKLAVKKIDRSVDRSDPLGAKGQS